MKASTTLRRLIAALLLLALRRLDDVAQRERLLVEVEVAEQVAHRLGAHAAAEVDPESVRRPETILELAEDLLVADDHLRLELLEEEPGLLEPPNGVDRGLARVLAPEVDVRDHLADLERPLTDRVEVLLAGALDETEVVRELAHGCRVRVGVDGSQHGSEQPVADLARSVEILAIDLGDERRVLLGQLGPGEEALLEPLQMLRDRALLRSRRLVELGAQWRQRGLDLDGGRSDRLDLARSEAAVVAGRRLANELANLPRILVRDLLGELDEHAAAERPDVLERRKHRLLGPVVQAADPEVVVLVEVALLACGEEVTPSGEAVVEPGERLVTVEVDALALARDLVLEVGEVGLALLAVDRRHDRGGEVEHLLELARSDVEQVADPAGHALEEPDVRDRSGEIDVPHPLAAHLLPSHLDAAALADDPLVADALVLAAVALPVLRRTEDALAEETVTLGLERAVVDRLRLRHLTGGPVADLLARCQTDPDRVEVVDVGTASTGFHLGPRTSLSVP